LYISSSILGIWIRLSLLNHHANSPQQAKKHPPAHTHTQARVLKGADEKPLEYVLGGGGILS
jgi:hypothetical protein